MNGAQRFVGCLTNPLLPQAKQVDVVLGYGYVMKMRRSSYSPHWISGSMRIRNERIIYCRFLVHPLGSSGKHADVRNSVIVHWPQSHILNPTQLSAYIFVL